MMIKWKVTTTISLAMCVSVAVGVELLQDISWSQLQAENRLGAGEVIAVDGRLGAVQLRLSNDEDAKNTFAVLELTEPGVTSSCHALRGQVRCEGVEGTGYLEMWNHFPDGSAFFSRTLAESGPMGRLTGTADWRGFELPFHIGEERTERPVKLEFNVVLPGRGTVCLSDLELVQYDRMEEALMADGQWWSGAMGGLIGGIAGSVIGCWGGLVGVLAGLGKGRGFVLGSVKAMMAIGVAALLGGMVAVMKGQPYAVYYPPVLLGGICVLVPGLNLRSIRRRYEQLELRKMTAMDVG